MKLQDILQRVNDRLKETVPALKYTDRNWGQLELDPPAVQLPCALTDIEAVGYENLLQGKQTAECEVSITVAALNFYNTSTKAGNKAKGYEIFDLLEEINSVLHGWGTPELPPMTRSALQKTEAGKDYSIYRLTYRTAFVTALEKHCNTIKAALKIHTEIPR